MNDLILDTSRLADGWTQREITGAIDALVMNLRNHDHIEIDGPITVTYDSGTKVFEFTARVAPSDDHSFTRFGFSLMVDFS